MCTKWLFWLIHFGRHCKAYRYRRRRAEISAKKQHRVSTFSSKRFGHKH
jgi:hypothetical protein